MIDRNTIHEADLFDLCAQLDAGSVDMILADLPYGTTACSWDTVIPFDPMWAAFKRIIKPRGAIVLTASQPFTSALVMSWPQGFRYEWIWEKTNAVDFAMATHRPRKMHENVLLFSVQPSVYYPEMEMGQPYIDKPRKRSNNVHASTMPKLGIVNTGFRYPSSVCRISNGNNSALHPTQKPVALFEYLIRTYTQPGELVFDPTAGSGTTAVAARQTGRDYIVGDSSPEYVAIMRERLGKPYTLPMLELEGQ
jgi:site-specific DNA-methyltransferase (adenine-specific)